MSLRRHLRAIVLLPGVVVIGVPTVIVYRRGGANLGWDLPTPLDWLTVILGAGLLGLGALLWWRSVALFATVGEGTLAPWDPPRKLVVRGPYRHVRNPMISGVLFILLGEATMVGSPPLLAWWLVFFAINALYTPLLEERGLHRRFGADYLIYKRNVPRWLPRLTPWEPGR